MRIRAIPGKFGGRLDISAPQTLQPGNLVGYSDFTGRSMGPGDILELADEYYNFPSIKNGIALGYLELLSFDNDPTAIVVQAELTATSGFSGTVLQVWNQGTVVNPSTSIINFIGTGVAAIQAPLPASTTQVNVYIPPPNYASHFNTSDGSTTATVAPWATTTRHVSAPTSEGNPFSIDGWAAGSSQPTIRDSSLVYATAGLFSVYDNSTTTFSVTVLDAGGIPLINNTQTITGNLNNTTNNIQIQITGFAPDSSKYKAQATVTIGIGAILPNGGRFSILIQHFDSTDGIFFFLQNNVFRDRDNVIAAISGNVSMTANFPVIKWNSGVQFYTIGSRFHVGITGIDHLNDESYPTTQVIVTAPSYDLPELDLAGASLTGWTNAYNTTGNSYDNANWQIATVNIFILTTTAHVTATPQDWTALAPVNSPNTGIAIDTYQPSQTGVLDHFNNEILRVTSAFAAWDSTQSLAAYDSGNGLQVLATRLVYPGGTAAAAINFVPYDPNHASQPNYTGLSGVRYYYRVFYQTNISHSNGTFQFSDYNITELNLTNDDVRIELSLDGTNWYNANLAYLGGALNNGDGCRINSDTNALNINSRIQFTFGTGLFTDVGTGGGWGAWVRITYRDNIVGRAAYMGSIQIIDWV